ncbi:flavodoxin family protein [Oscillospiraceae bacterium CM]|nr:flavodoxin family protein [Oscillospiraceae bacterium CM]
MNIGIVVHSHTQNTLSVGERLKEALAAKGHTVALKRVIAVNEDPTSNQPVLLAEAPDVSGDDYVIFGAPVRAFSISPVMKVYLQQMSSINGKKVACFVTQYLKKPWMGGNRAVRQMTRLAASLNGSVVHTGIVNWTSPARDEQIETVLSEFCLV